jgi:hypothetical protein
MLSQIRWLRVLIAAFLVEAGLMAMVPLIPLVGQDLMLKVVAPIACVVIPFVVAFVATRPLPAARAVHGLLIGIVATGIYFALVIGLSSVEEAVASYGSVALFAGVNALRLVSAAAGGYVADRRAVSSAA